MAGIRINLLPHREQKRQARQRQFISLALSLGVLALAVVALVHGILSAQIDSQKDRNALLKKEIAKLDEQIKEIDRLRDQIQAVLARKQVVETLQANRSEAVHLLDQLVRQLPDGIYLSSVRQTGAKVTVTGYAQSNARVSTLMRNIEASPWLTSPELVEIKLVPAPGVAASSDLKINAFTMSFVIKRVAPAEDKGPAAPAKGAPRPHQAASARKRRRHRDGEGGMNLDDLRRLNIRDVGNWPLLPKILILVGIFAVIVIAGALLDWRDQWDALEAAQQEETGLKDQYAQKKAKAINFELYVQQLSEVEQSFGALVKQLPNRSEIDALLTDINQAGLGRGLQFELFRPSPQERMQDFYAELPIRIKITGNYHDMGAFASDVAQLPRIVTLNDVQIANEKGTLSLEAEARTFRYLDDEEIAKQRAIAKAKEKKGRRRNEAPRRPDSGHRAAALRVRRREPPGPARLDGRAGQGRARQARPAAADQAVRALRVQRVRPARTRSSRARSSRRRGRASSRRT